MTLTSFPPPLVEQPLSRPPPSPPASPTPQLRYVQLAAPSPVQYWAQWLGTMALGLAFWFGFAGLVAANTALGETTGTAPPGETFLNWTTWGHETVVAGPRWVVTVAYPPVAVIVALALGLLISYVRIDVGRRVARARKDNGLPALRRRDPEAKETRVRARTMLRAAGVPGRFGQRSRGPTIALLVLSMVGSASLVALGLHARSWLPSHDLVVGVGPTVSVIAGSIAFVAALVAMPWRPARTLAVGPHGEVITI